MTDQYISNSTSSNYVMKSHFQVVTSVILFLEENFRINFRVRYK